jgi:hypothetical protein
MYTYVVRKLHDSSIIAYSCNHEHETFFDCLFSHIELYGNKLSFPLIEYMRNCEFVFNDRLAKRPPKFLLTNGRIK